jgi:hypothetical protein
VAEKRPYSAPQVTRVALNHEQAILQACSTLTTTVNSTNGTDYCMGAAPPCKHPNSTKHNGDMASNLS